MVCNVYYCRSEDVLAVEVVMVLPLPLIVSFLVSLFSFFWVVGVALLPDLLQICCRSFVFASAHLLMSAVVQVEMMMRGEQVTAPALFPPLIRATGEVKMWEGLGMAPDLFPPVIQVKGEVGMGEGWLW